MGKSYFSKDYRQQIIEHIYLLPERERDIVQRRAPLWNKAKHTFYSEAELWAYMQTLEAKNEQGKNIKKNRAATKGHT